MAPPTNTVSCQGFTQSTFSDVVRHASGLLATAPPNAQTRYLGRYLERLGAKTLVIESHYIDRHYIEEYEAYYVRCLTQRDNHCVRIHVFDTCISGDELTGSLAKAKSGSLDSVREELQEAYLGFVVIRPLPAAPIGRTVLKTFPSDATHLRRFDPSVKYEVFFFGLSLTIRGLAFQQQDIAVGACATTAVWSALQSVHRREQSRAPTPPAVTRAAVSRFTGGGGRTSPSRNGLNEIQIFDCIQDFDFHPEFFEANDPHAFLRYLNIYVRSGIPVILGVLTPSGIGHAITAVGFREEATDYDFSDFGDFEYRSRNLHFKQIYVHDDRVGPCARARVLLETQLRLHRPPRQTLTENLFLILEDDEGEFREELLVIYGIAPVYPKIRCNARDLLRYAGVLSPFVATELHTLGAELSSEVFFARSGDYLKRLYKEKTVDPVAFSHFVQTASLSRYVGVARYFLDGSPAMDAIWDTTDIERGPRGNLHNLLGFVSHDRHRRPLHVRLAQYFGVPVG